MVFKQIPPTMSCQWETWWQEGRGAKPEKGTRTQKRGEVQI